VKKPSEVFYAVATGPERRRRLLTPVGLLIFIGLLLLVVFASRFTDRALGLPQLLPGAPGSVVGAILVALGIPLWGWCLVLFKKARGTGIPFNPPWELVVVGPYAWIRNPMLTGVFSVLFGIGFLTHSVSMVLFWTPVFVVLNAIELRLVEEPELELRLGASYSEYRQRVPMFLPRAPDPPRKSASSNKKS
jgi:protein-S-isoprenylcysteine O-methyltransferase Ste14